jgi:5'-3' exonuclease
MKYNTFIVDCYNLMYKATYTQNETIVKYDNENVHIEGIIGFINIIEYYIKLYSTSDLKIYWLFDNAKTTINKYRKSLSEDYKKTRKLAPDWFYRSIDILELLLKFYKDNCYVVRAKYLEADDYVSEIINNNTIKTDNILLISEDSDWSRSLQDNVHQLQSGFILTKEEFFSRNGYEATYSNICFYKSFYGDTTDNILPILREFPNQFFLDVISVCTTMHEFIRKVKEKQFKYLDSGWIERIHREEENLLLNWNLVTGVEISFAELKTFMISSSFKEATLKIIYESLSLYGKIDTSRFPVIVKKTDILKELLNGISIERKKS